MEKYTGLSKEEVIQSRKKYGTNEIRKQKLNGFFHLLIGSLGDPIIKILLIALIVKIVFLFKDFDWFETLGILIAIFLSSLVSTISEYGSEKAFSKLQEESSKLKCVVIRNSKKKEIFADELVKNDLVVMQTGDKVPADGYVLDGFLSVDESSINGESKEVMKTNKNNDKVYKGTIVYGGNAVVKITEVGDNTFYGKIAGELTEKQDESPLKLRLRKLAKVISTFGYIGAFLTCFSYLFSVIVISNSFDIQSIILTITNFPIMMNHLIHALTLAVTIIIVSVPEGLPMMITLVLSSNMKRMLKDNVLVRKLVGIETAGSLNILFSDKTGTITTGKLSCSKIIDGNLNEYKKEEDIKNKKYYKLLKSSMIINNMASYEGNNIIGGNTTDKCLLSFFKPSTYNVKIINQVPFDSKNKYMITTIDDDKIRNLIKGAPESILKYCTYMYDENSKKVFFKNKNHILDEIEKQTQNGIRVIVLATSNYLTSKLFKDLVFVGAIFIKDKVRDEAYEGIKLVKNAGINTVMITGDNKKTAVAIAKEVGLITSEKDIVLTSDELNKKNDIELKQMLPNLKVIARSYPQDKSRLVKIAKEMDLVVGMTGDGVNDAPALKKADVGFAMASGSEVAKEASDIVILDDNFLSISKAILFGRTIFKSIRKFIIFQLTVNLCALSISIMGPFIGVDSPVTVIQMLWINMVMDTLAGLAFSFEPPLLEYMNEKPKKKNENIINKYMISEIIVTGLYTSVMCIIFLKLPLIRYIFSNYDKFMTAFFGLFIFSGIFNCFNARTSRINVLSNLLKNKMFIIVITFIVMVQVFLMYYLGDIFRTTPLSVKEFLITIILSSLVLPVDMIRKILCKKYGKSRMV